MKLVYTHDNHALVATVVNHLLQNDIEVITRNQYAAAAQDSSRQLRLGQKFGLLMIRIVRVQASLSKT